MESIKNIIGMIDKKKIPVMMGPIIGIIIGSIVGSMIKPSMKSLAVLRHIAAGLVIAAFSTELTPEIAEADGYKNRIAVISGIVIGLALMIVLRTIFSKEEETMSIEVISSVAIDFFIDAMLIGIALASTTNSNGYIMAIALGIEMFILSLTTISQARKAGSSSLSMVFVSALFVVVVVAGMYIGMYFANRFKNSSTYYLLIAFGVAALMWLVTEDLLSKSKYLDSRIGATMLFLGFLSVIILGWLNNK